MQAECGAVIRAGPVLTDPAGTAVPCANLLPGWEYSWHSMRLAWFLHLVWSVHECMKRLGLLET